MILKPFGGQKQQFFLAHLMLLGRTGGSSHRAGSAGLSWAASTAVLRNCKQEMLAKPEHKGQGQEGKEHRGGCTGALPQAGTQGKGLSKVLSILLGQHHIKSSLYDSWHTGTTWPQIPFEIGSHSKAAGNGEHCLGLQVSAVNAPCHADHALTTALPLASGLGLLSPCVPAYTHIFQG